MTVLWNKPSPAVTSALPPSANAIHRYHELDSIRGLAALIVVFHHFFYMWFFTQASSITLRGLIWYPLVAGHESVVLFFLLSGFVLSLPYLHGKGQNYPTFLLRRILRIYCPYLFALAAAGLANKFWYGQLPLGSWSHQTWAAPTTWKDIYQGVLMLGVYNWQRLNTAFWSLIIEMRISIIFPFLFLAVRKMSLRMGLLTAAACSLVIRLAGPAGRDPRTLVYTLQYVTVFLCGILMAVHLQQLKTLYRNLSRAKRIAFAAGAILLYELSHLTSMDIFWRLEDWHVRDWPLIAGAGGLMLIGMESPHVRKFLNSTIPSFLGRISYSLYLVHGTVLFAVTFLLQGRVPRAIVFPIYLAGALSLSTIFCLLIEEPFTRLSRQVGKSRKIPPRRITSVVDKEGTVAA